MLPEIFTDFVPMLIPLRAFQGDTTEEIIQKTQTYQMEELTRLASGDLNEIQNRLREEENLLEGNYGDLFDKRYSKLNDIEMKYGKFFEPSIRKPLIDLQRLMKSLAGNIRVRLKLRGTAGEFLIPSIEDKVFHRVHDIMKVLDEFRTLELLEIR